MDTPEEKPTFEVPEGHTLLTNEELKQLTRKNFENGINEATDRKLKALGKKITPLGLQLGEDFDSTVDTIVDALNNRGKSDNEQIQTYEAKVKALAEQNSKLEQERNDAYNTRDSYIVDSELSNTFNGQAVNNKAALTMLKSEYSIKRNADGTIAIRDGSGNRVTNPKTGDPATLSEVADMFLKSNPYLMNIKDRPENIKAPQGGVSDSNLERIMAKAPSEMTASDQKAVYEAAKTGSIDGHIVTVR